ncbi:MAG TPA: hypothetical protein VKR38_03555 [Usitatibacter sp.]|nr:hypothetical protein [Usitatibacter sp.]
MSTDRESLNRAFWDLGLRFQWNPAVWSELSSMPDLRAQLAHYLEHYQPHLLAVYDVDFLRNIIEERLAHPAPDARMGMEAHRSF